MCGPDSSVSGGLSGGLPLLADFRQKTLASRALLAQILIAAVSVVANRRSDNKNVGALGRFRQRFREMTGALYAAIPDLLLFIICPATHDGFTGKMHDRVET